MKTKMLANSQICISVPLKFTDKLKKQSSRGALSKDILKNFAKFTEKHLGNPFFNKVAGWKPETIRNSYWRSSVK